MLQALLLPLTLSVVKSFLPIPQFYASADCSGPINPASRGWSTPAKRGGVVKPFMTDGTYLQLWSIGACLNDSTTAYSVMVDVNTTACANNNGAQVMQLKYWSGSTSCSGAATVTPMNFTTCMPYALGSVRITNEISIPDVCTATNFVTAMKTGGMRVQQWNSSDCTGTVLSNTVNTDTQKDCAAEPECEGCCADYSSDTCVAENYMRQLTACRTVGSTREVAMGLPKYTDAQCTNFTPSFWGKTRVDVGACLANTKSFSFPVSTRITFVPPMSADVQCALVDVSLKNGIDASVVTWSELNAALGGASAAAPYFHFIAVLVSVFVLLM